MERRSFIRGAFGFVALTALAGVGGATASGASHPFVTPLIPNPEFCVGPVMQAGLALVGKDNTVKGMRGGTHLFNVDATGAELIRLADGTMTLDEMASAVSTPVNPADVACFFVALGQAGYLANTVLVNLSENKA